MSHKEKPMVSQEPVVLLHGFPDEALLPAIHAVKAAAAEAGMDAGAIAFTTSTPTNLEWKVKALIREVRKEHGLFHPPAP